MPRSVSGLLIKCDKTIRMFLENLDRSKEIILYKLDENHILIRENEEKYVREKIEELQNENYKEENR